LLCPILSKVPTIFCNKAKTRVAKTRNKVFNYNLGAQLVEEASVSEVNFTKLEADNIKY